LKHIKALKHYKVLKHAVICIKAQSRMHNARHCSVENFEV